MQRASAAALARVKRKQNAAAHAAVMHTHTATITPTIDLPTRIAEIHDPLKSGFFRARTDPLVRRIILERTTELAWISC
jgi:hypothetical protein